MRRSWSVPWFIVSQLAFVINGVATLLNPNAYEVPGSVGWIWSIGTVVLGVRVVLYRIAMTQRGVLSGQAIAASSD